MSSESNSLLSRPTGLEVVPSFDESPMPPVEAAASSGSGNGSGDRGGDRESERSRSGDDDTSRVLKEREREESRLLRAPSHVDEVKHHRHHHSFNWSNFLFKNASAGMTVALINIPLSIALAVASLSTPLAGILTAVWSGFVCGMFGGSKFNITGPTGALSGILSKYVTVFGVDALPYLAVTTSLAIGFVYAFNLDNYIRFLPSSVSHGFTLGVAFIIAGGQFASMFGLPPMPQHEHFYENMYEVFAHITLFDYHSFLVFLFGWLSLYLLVRKWPRIPWMVLIVTVGIGLGYLSKQGHIFYLKTLGDKYGTLTATLFHPPPLSSTTVASSSSNSMPSESTLSRMMSEWPSVVAASCSIAFISVLESLISGKIADAITHTHMNQRKEVIGLAIANMATGLAGGMPSTAALARTALNIRSGATSRLACVLNSLFTGAIALLLLPFFSYLPLCIVASLLFQVALGMIEMKHLKQAYTIDRASFTNTVIVAVMCLIFDPTVGIVVGAIVGLINQAEVAARGFSEVVITHSSSSGGSVGGGRGGGGSGGPTRQASMIQLDVHKFDKGHRTKSSPRLTAFRHLFSDIEEEERSRHTNMSSVEEGEGVSSSGEHHEHHFTDTDDEWTSAQQRQYKQHNTVVYRIIGDLSYISAISHMERLKAFVDKKAIVISFQYCNNIDLDGLQMLENIIDFLGRSGKRKVLLANIPALIHDKFSKTKWYPPMHDGGRVFATVSDAVKSISTTTSTSSSSFSSSFSSSSTSASNSVNINMSYQSTGSTYPRHYDDQPLRVPAPTDSLN